MWDGARWQPGEALAIDTRRDAAAGRRLKSHWARVGIDRLEAGADGQFSYNVFAVSEADLERIRELFAGTFRTLRAIVGESTPSERVVVVNLHVFPLSGPGQGDQGAG